MTQVYESKKVLLYELDRKTKEFVKLVTKKGTMTINATDLGAMVTGYDFEDSTKPILEFIIGPRTKLKKFKEKFYSVSIKAIKKTFAFKFAILTDATSFEESVNKAIADADKASQAAAESAPPASKASDSPRTSTSSPRTSSPRTSTTSPDISNSPSLRRKASIRNNSGSRTGSPDATNSNDESPSTKSGHRKTISTGISVRERTASLKRTGSLGQYGALPSSPKPNRATALKNAESPVVAARSLDSALDTQSLESPSTSTKRTPAASRVQKDNSRRRLSLRQSPKTQAAKKTRSRFGLSSTKSNPDEDEMLIKQYRTEGLEPPAADAKPLPCRIYIESGYKSVPISPKDSVTSLKSKIARKVPGSIAQDFFLWETDEATGLLRKLADNEFPLNVLIRWKSSDTPNAALDQNSTKRLYFLKDEPTVGSASSSGGSSKSSVSNSGIGQSIARKFSTFSSSRTKGIRQRPWDGISAIDNLKKSIQTSVNTFLLIQQVKQLQKGHRFERLDRGSNKRTKNQLFCYLLVDDTCTSLMYGEDGEDPNPKSTKFTNYTHSIPLKNILTVATNRVSSDKLKLDSAALAQCWTINTRGGLVSLEEKEDPPGGAPPPVNESLDLRHSDDFILASWVDGLRGLLGRNTGCSITEEARNSLSQLDIDLRMFNLDLEQINAPPPKVPPPPADFNFITDADEE